MMERLYADENFPYPVVETLRRLGDDVRRNKITCWIYCRYPVVEALRRLGYDVLTLQEQGYGGQAISDEDVLRLANEAERTMWIESFCHVGSPAACRRSGTLPPTQGFIMFREQFLHMPLDNGFLHGFTFFKNGFEFPKLLFQFLNL